VTKKTGNAPERNRIRRRLREAIRRAGADLDGIGGDFVIIGRREALTVPFDGLVRGLSEAIRRLAEGGRPAAAPESGVIIGGSTIGLLGIFGLPA
jgi:ribonuclease P protein component